MLLYNFLLVIYDLILLFGNYRHKDFLRMSLINELTGSHNLSSYFEYNMTYADVAIDFKCEGMAVN